MDQPSASQVLVQFIRQLTWDGELTSEEVWQLASFLNENGEAAQCWPGNVLVPLLQGVWADGEVSEEELMALMQMLQLVEREWGQRGQRREPPPAQEVLPRAVPPPIEAEFRLPTVPRVLEVESSQGDDWYSVDLANQTCTCPDFRKLRRGFGIGDMSRGCKHLVSALSGHSELWDGPNLAVEAVLSSLAELGKGTPAGGSWYVFQSFVGAFCVTSSDWVNVYLQEGDGSFECYGFSPSEDRWSYGMIPSRQKEIEESILSVCRDR